MVSHSRAVITVTAEIWLGSLLLLNFNSNDLDLVVGEADFNFELIRHNKLISLDRIVVILLLLLLVVVGLLLLLLLLLLLIFLMHLSRFEFKAITYFLYVGVILLLRSFSGWGGLARFILSWVFSGLGDWVLSSIVLGFFSGCGCVDGFFLSVCHNRKFI